MNQRRFRNSGQWSTRRWARWTATFVGFPLAGVVARGAVGNIDSLSAAALGGLVGGLTLGTLQATIGGLARGQRIRWVLGTGAGLAVGLTAGAAAIDYRTDAASLVALGAITGAVVGAAQAASSVMGAADRLRWMLATPVLWAVGWLITANVIVDADRQHAVFGASGALAVSLLSGLLAERWTHMTTQTASSSSESHAACVVGVS